MKLCEMNPHIRYARVHETLPTSTKYSRCYDCRLFFLKLGSAALYMDGREYKISNNTAVYLPPASAYRIVRRSEEFLMAIFNFDLVSEFSHIKSSLGTVSEDTFDPALTPRYELPCEFAAPLIITAPQLYEPLKRCADGFLKAERHFRESGSALLKFCLIELLRCASSFSAESRLAEAAKDYIVKNYSDPELTNESIAAHFGYHPYYLSRVMKLTTGKTLHHAITEHRIRMAKDMLITTEHDISVISWKCGFNSAAYFTKIFREHVGITPKEYRRSHAVGV